MLQLFCREEYAFVEGPVVELSKKRPVTKEDILRQMHKTGTVPFELENFEVNMEEDCFLPMSVLKTVRQKGFSLLEERLKNTKRRSVLENNKINKIVCLEKEGLKEDFTKNFTGKISIDERIATVYNREQCMIGSVLLQNFSQRKNYCDLVRQYQMQVRTFI